MATYRTTLPRLARVLVWCTLFAFMATQVHADPAAHAEGLAAGQAAMPTVRNSLQAPSAQTVVPGYTATPPERAYYGPARLDGAAHTRLADCALSPADPVCQALLGATTSAQTPRQPVGAYDPAVLGARRIAGNPASQLEDVGSFYSGCQIDTASTATTESRICRQYNGTSARSCARTLTVDVTSTSSCTPGEWIAQAGSGGLALALQCRPGQPDNRQRMRLTEFGAPSFFFDTDVNAAYVFPQPVQTLSADWRGVQRAVWVVDNRCNGNSCELTGFVAEPLRQICTGGGDSEQCVEERPFVEVYSACPAGTQSGNNIVMWGSEDTGTFTTLDEGRCYAPSQDPRNPRGHDVTWTLSSWFWQAQTERGVVGYRQNPAYGPNPPIVMRFERPHTTVTETDQWTDGCTTATSGERCRLAATERCVEGPATREINGAPVTRACWRYETALSCEFGQPGDECAPLVAAGCKPSTSLCRETDVATGQCTVTEQIYACPVASTTTATARNCPSDVFCIAGSCFNTAAPADPDFARAMAFLEAAREAGVYLDTDLLQVFKGEPNRCRDRLLKNCCTTDSAGRGMHNQSLFGVGSRLVYDVLMNSGNREFLYQGMQALLMSGGFSGSFTSYGVTVAVNGTALPAGSSLLYAGDSMVIAFDAWSLAISVVMYAVMSAMSCDAEENKLAMKEGARLCHAVGTYCSSCIRVLGRCVSCITHTTNKCCFNSPLARIVQEQGRQQLGKSWGSARAPDCSGFTVAQLQQLDFARMDLSEFYAAIVPTLPNAETMQERNLGRAGGCYYGEGRCP